MNTTNDPFHGANALLKHQGQGDRGGLPCRGHQRKGGHGLASRGRVTAVLGTHTHIPTADQRVLPGGTAYQTDVGMSGPYDSVIGVEKELVLHSS